MNKDHIIFDNELKPKIDKVSDVVPKTINIVVAFFLSIKYYIGLVIHCHNKEAIKKAKTKPNTPIIILYFFEMFS